MNMKHFACLAIAGMMTTLVACKDTGITPPPSEQKEKEAAAPLPGISVFQLDSKWKTQTGKEINIADLGGKVSVVAMVYTSCRAACPRIIADVEHIGTGLGDKKADVNFVLFSMDPQHDSPEKMMQLAQDYRITSPNWILLTGDDNATLELANVLDVRIRRDEKGNITDHSNLIFVLDKGGVIRHRQEGLSVSPEGSVAAINDLLASSSGN